MREQIKTLGEWFGEYLSELRELYETISWSFREFIADQSKKVARRVILFRFLAGLMGILRAWSISLLFDAVILVKTTNNFELASTELIKSLIIFILLGKVGSFFNLRADQWRERLMGINSGYLDWKVSKMFLVDHSLGTHISEDTNLNEANVRKGHEYLSKIQNILLFQGIETALSLILPIGAIIVLSWKINSHFMMIAPIALFLIFFTFSFYLARSIVKDAGPIDDEWRAYHRYRVERLREPERVKNSGKEKCELNELKNKYDKVIAADLKYWLWYILRSHDRNALTEWYVELVLCFAFFQALLGKISLGLLYPINSWSWKIVEALWRLADIELQINKSVPAIMALKRSLTLPMGIEMPKNPVVLPDNIPLRIEFRGVSYRYQNTKKNISVPVLKNISFVIEPGEKVALIGHSGAGKTTLIRLLLRYMDPTEGEILVNGIDLKQIELSSWLARIGYVPQQAAILSGSVRYNAVYGLPDGETLSDEEIWEKARPLQLDFGESRLTEGLDTKVGYKGIKLSGGQAQRLMIVAAIMKGPDILLLDEATSSLDSTTEKFVQQGLSKYLPAERNAVINAHRLPTVRHICNKFIFLENDEKEGSRVGAIARSFEELSEKSDSFKQLTIDQDIVL